MSQNHSNRAVYLSCGTDIVKSSGVVSVSGCMRCVYMGGWVGECVEGGGGSIVAQFYL